jgi:uncharacterized phosphosugar-binding protein
VRPSKSADGSGAPLGPGPGNPTLTAGAAYQDRLADILRRALDDETGSVQEAATVAARTFDAEGLLYIFGSGHSHMFAEEAFYRAGGAARVCPILKPPHMLHEGAVRSTRLERRSGLATEVLSGYELDRDRDCMVVVSNSGSNALPLEVASAAGEAGLPVIAITSRAYAATTAQTGPRLHDLADIVVDNHCPPGDALVTLDPELPPVGPASTIVGLALLNSIIVEALGLQIRDGRTPDVFVSAGMPNGTEHNEAVVAQLAARVPHL